jgi:hypothetical protein
MTLRTVEPFGSIVHFVVGLRKLVAPGCSGAASTQSAMVDCPYETFGRASSTRKSSMDLRRAQILQPGQSDDGKGSGQGPGRHPHEASWGRCSGTSRQSCTCHVPHPGVSRRCQASEARQRTGHRPGMKEGGPWFVLVAGINGAGKSTFAQNHGTLHVLLETRGPEIEIINRTSSPARSCAPNQSFL